MVHTVAHITLAFLTLVLAKGEAEAMEIKGRAIRENSQVLQQLAIEKWNGVLPTYVGGSGPIPFVPVK